MNTHRTHIHMLQLAACSLQLAACSLQLAAQTSTDLLNAVEALLEQVVEFQLVLLDVVLVVLAHHLEHA